MSIAYDEKVRLITMPMMININAVFQNNEIIMGFFGDGKRMSSSLEDINLS